MPLKITTAKVADLIPYAANAKEHPEWQVKQIAASIREYGMNDPIAIWHDPEGRPVIVEGHGRLLALEMLGVKTCPIITLDHLSDGQRRAYTLVHNQLTMNTRFDADMLEAELMDLAPDIDLSKYGLHVTMPDEITNDDEAGTDDYIPVYDCVVKCNSEENQLQTIEKLMNLGYEVKPIQ